MKRHAFKFTPENIRKIEYILPKIKYSSYIGNVIKWLENFETAEIELAIDFLMFFEYIPLNELQSRLEEQISNANSNIPREHLILLIPFTSYPKSNDIIAYLISKLRSYSHMQASGRMDITRDFESYKYSKKTSLLFIDDFIGTGDSFLKSYRNRKIGQFIGNNDELINNDIYLLAAIIMNKGSEYLKYKIPELVIFAEKRFNCFCTQNSPFLISQGAKKMKALALKYGTGLRVLRRGEQDIYYPLGYGNCEALISFDYGPPNNTLPIFWSSASSWHPIFPRIADDKIAQSSAIKKSVAFYIGIMKMLGLSLYTDYNVLISGATYKYDSRLDHSLVTVMFLLNKKYNEIIICQILGITIKELTAIYQYGKQRRLLDSKNTLTLSGSSFISELINKAKKQKFRSKAIRNFERNNLIYVPNSFKGVV
ncbi:hypothetical protein BEL04_22735 [Mucilaginibacter sp. PPCGB 2223]|uniref:phosphoribosyltransferase-like protein n=1 Tax=Mucilaginibacter sp. PPCGB 2223 TaxID=1886027 RepID=UPI00082492B3|nr:hypothetical protein [Mucilaginibacter sp. PPCGB 2223]OCX50594.1 hypothetical protein BEL04_22735 [Mucilaginibacter sp. PPCGB 2223]